MFAVVYVPQFSLQAVLRHEPELWTKPVALVGPGSRTPVVCDLTDPACAAGVTPGLTPTQAMARCTQVLIRPRSLRQENTATATILQCAYMFSPHLEATAPGLCTLDLRGLAALRGADRAALEDWARKLPPAFANIQLAVSIGVGPTPNLARHAARWGSGLEIVEEPKTFLPGLPVGALEPSPEIALLLKRWGICTVGELLALGQDALAARLGLDGLALLAAASSTTLRPLHLTQPPERFEETFDLEPAVETLEPLLFLLRRFVNQLSQRLEPRGLAAETLLLQLALESGQNLVARLRLPQPTCQPDVLFRTLHTHLETLRTESPIKALSLTVIPTEQEQKQLGLFETILADPRRFQETLARLTAVLGPNRVGTPTLENSHRPDAFRLAAPDFENAPVPMVNTRPTPVHITPLRRFRPALKAEVECELQTRVLVGSSGFANPSADYSQRPPETASSASSEMTETRWARPISVRCAITKGKLKVVVGPWRASGNWWDPGMWEREEWDAATPDGQVIRLVRQPDGWFVEGVVD